MTVVAWLKIILVISLILICFPGHFFRIHTVTHFLIWVLTKLHSFEHLFKRYTLLSLFNHFLVHAFVVVFVLPTFLFYVPCLLGELRHLLYLLLRLSLMRRFVLVCSSTFAFYLIWRWLRCRLNSFGFNVGSISVTTELLGVLFYQLIN